MPEGDMSEDTRHMKMLLDALRHRIKTLKDEMRVPFGYRALTPGQLKSEWPDWQQEERDAMMQRPDWPEIESKMMRTGE